MFYCRSLKRDHITEFMQLYITELGIKQVYRTKLKQDHRTEHSFIHITEIVLVRVSQSFN
jgi:uncharacterized metal-binding protein